MRSRARSDNERVFKAFVPASQITLSTLGLRFWRRRWSADSNYARRPILPHPLFPLPPRRPCVFLNLNLLFILRLVVARAGDTVNKSPSWSSASSRKTRSSSLSLFPLLSRVTSGEVFLLVESSRCPRTTAQKLKKTPGRDRYFRSSGCSQLVFARRRRGTNCISFLSPFLSLFFGGLLVGRSVSRCISFLFEEISFCLF